MSGGVDSSVAAYLLQDMSDESTKVAGLHMSNWNALDEDTDRSELHHNINQRKDGASNKDSENYPTNGRKSNNIFCETSEKEYNDSQSVARHLSIPLHRVSFASEYWLQVFEPFVESLSTPTYIDDDQRMSYGELNMPNPDFNCNTFIKFGAMREYAINNLGADFVATGHYAQLLHRNYDFSSKFKQRSQSDFFKWLKDTSIKLEDQVQEAIEGRPEEEWLRNNRSQLQDNSHNALLISGADRSKDQTYFLSGVKAVNFKHVIFPLGHLAKKHITPQLELNDQCTSRHTQQSVRDIAHQVKIPTASKKDSMGICFIGKRNFGRFVSQYLPETPSPGNFVDIDTGKIVGKHQGSMYYTVGQGAKISGASIKYFVCGKGDGTNDIHDTVFVCNDTHHPSLYTDELFVDFNDFNWIGPIQSRNTYNFGPVPAPLLEGRPIELLARTRHLQPLVKCTVTWQRHFNSKNNHSLGMLAVKFYKPIRAITPGQIVALYAGTDGLICLGGGPIYSRGQSFMERGLDISLFTLHPSGHNDLSLLT